ncbi:MAG: F0F1 ATP synthase subunit A [Myxococcota bacterium]
MKRWLGIIVLSGLVATGFAFASSEGEAGEHGEHGQAAGEHGAANAGGESHGGGGHSKAEETAHFILHHVADDEVFELEIPFPPYHLFTVNIAEVFHGLVWEGESGACAKEIPAGMVNFPSLAKWLNGCYDFRPTKAILMMWVASALLILLAVMGRKRDQNGVPKGVLAHVIESMALFVRDEIVIPSIGKDEAPRYTIYFTSLFFFILSVNWLGLIPGFFTGTGVVAVTASLAVLTFLMTQLAGIRSAGLGGYLAHLTGGVPAFLWPIMIPVEFLGLFTKPFALLARLFANMLGGHMVLFFLLALIFVWTVGAAAVSVPLAIAIYCLEIFVGILQAYLFVLLSAIFVGQGVAMGHHGHDGEHAH